MVALAKGGESQGVGRRAIEDKIDITIGLEKITELFTGSAGGIVIAIRRQKTSVGLF